MFALQRLTDRENRDQGVPLGESISCCHLSVHSQNVQMNRSTYSRVASCGCNHACCCSSSSSSSTTTTTTTTTTSRLPVFLCGRRETFRNARRGFRLKLPPFFFFFSEGNGHVTVAAMTLAFYVISGCVLPPAHGSMTSSAVPEISEFSSNERRVFTDRSNPETFFHHFYIDPQNSSSIYIGALDFVYRLNADNISRAFERSENITNFSSFKGIYLRAESDCRNSRTVGTLSKKFLPSYQCRNHIRGILPNFRNREIYVCGTGSYSPQDFYLDMKTLRVLRIGFLNGVSSGITKCPYDPNANHTIIYVGPNAGTPNNLSAIYSSLLVGYNYHIYRSALQRDPHSATVDFPPLRSQEERTNGELFYIASFEIDQYVYFFFRELAVESSLYGRKHHSRVARVCKNDTGGRYERNRFLTYVKATLNCSVGTNDIPVYFDELYDVVYDSVKRVFHCLFMANVNAMWGSAVCQFDYEAIERKFDSGQFYARQTTNSQWMITPDNQVPVPRPSLCRSDRQSLSTTVESFVLSNTLMYGTVDQMTKSPLYYTHSVSYNRLAVDYVHQFTVLYLYSFTNPSEIVRVVAWSDENESIHFRKFSVLKLFADSGTPKVWDMKIHSINGRKWLYVVSESSVIQVSVQLCSSYGLCTDCVKDPYCGWNASALRCQDFQRRESSNLLQGVSNASSISICRPSCTVRTERRALPGAALHLGCSSRCSPDGDVVWTWQRSGSAHQDTVQVFSDPNYVLSRNDGLVILNVSRYHIGTFRCISEGITLAEHSVATSACQYGEDVREIWIREFVSWCTAFDQYLSEYNMWLCLKDKCLKSSCISQEVVNGCRKRQLT